VQLLHSITFAADGKTKAPAIDRLQSTVQAAFSKFAVSDLRVEGKIFDKTRLESQHSWLEDNIFGVCTLLHTTSCVCC